MVRIRQRSAAALAATLVLGFGLVAGCKKEEGGAAGGKSGDSSTASSASDDLSLLPADSEVVIGINLKQLQQAPLWKSMIEPKLMTGEAQRRLAEFKTKCNFDPVTAMGSIVVGVKNTQGDKPDGVAVIRGVEKARALDCLDKSKDEMTKNGTEMTKDGDVLLFKGKTGETVAVSFVSGDTAIAVFGANGNAAGVKAVASGASGLKNSASFLEMYKKIKTGESVWVMASGKTLEKVPGGATAAYGSLNVTDGLALDLRMRFATPDAATQAVSMANAQAKQAAKYVDKAEFTGDGNELHASVVMSAQKLAELAPMLGMLMGGMGGGGQ
jgi:hypothetical protein